MTETKATNIHKHKSNVSRHDRERLNGHRGITLWFTGLSGLGKSTVAVAMEEALYDRGCRTYILDGDNIRTGINRDLGFAPEDRVENIRRIGEIAKLYRDTGVINLVAFISPYRAERELARSLSEGDDFLEIFVECPVEVCEQRDPKGLYKKARAGEIPEFTGISAPYDVPKDADLVLPTHEIGVSECVDQIVALLEERGVI